MKESERVIRDSSGKVIHRSHNLRGIRAYVKEHVVKNLSVDRLGNGEGKLSMLFTNGSSYETNFADFRVLLDCVRRWRSVYDAPLTVNGVEKGVVGFHNTALRGDQK